MNNPQSQSVPLDPASLAELDDAALKEEYLGHLAPISHAVAPFRLVVKALVGRGYSRKELLRWGVEAGHQWNYLRCLLSKAFIEAGIRVRRPGAGRKRPPEAQLVADSMRRQYGARAAKILTAARSILREQDVAAARAARQEPSLLLAKISPLPETTPCRAAA